MRLLVVALRQAVEHIRTSFGGSNKPVAEIKCVLRVCVVNGPEYNAQNQSDIPLMKKLPDSAASWRDNNPVAADCRPSMQITLPTL